MSKIKHILFDFDLTLVDSSYSIFITANKALKKLGFEKKTLLQIRKTIGCSLEKSFVILTGCNDTKLAKKYSKEFLSISQNSSVETIMFYDNIIGFLNILFENQYVLSIISSKDEISIKKILKLHNLENLFEIIIGLESVKNQKPHPEGIQLAISRLNAYNNECIYVGDSILDAEAADNANIKFFPVLTGNHNRDDFLKFPCEKILFSVNDLAEYLKI